MTLKEFVKGIADKIRAIRQISNNIAPNTFSSDHLAKIDAFVTSLRNSVTKAVIPEGTTSIVDSAFKGCKALTEVKIPESVTQISGAAFQSCSSLTEITFPSNLKHIGGYAFGSCINCETFDFTKCIRIPNLGTNAFYNINPNAKILVPASLYEKWRDETNWVQYAKNHIRPDSSYLYEDYENGVRLTTFYNPDNVSEVEIPQTIDGKPVVSIGDLVFENHYELTKVIIPNSVTSIGSSAFHYCTGLTSVTIPNSAISIGDYAFEGCYGLTSVTIGNSVTTIGNSAFIDCSSLKSITLPYSTKTIGDYAFAYSGITSFDVRGSNLEQIGSGAFVGCSNCTTYNFSECGGKIPALGDNVFDGMNSNAVILVLGAYFEKWITDADWGKYAGQINYTDYLGGEDYIAQKYRLYRSPVYEPLNNLSGMQEVNPNKGNSIDVYYQINSNNASKGDSFPAGTLKSGSSFYIDTGRLQEAIWPDNDIARVRASDYVEFSSPGVYQIWAVDSYDGSLVMKFIFIVTED